MGDIQGFNLSQNTVQELMKVKRRKDEQKKIDDANAGVDTELQNRDKARTDYQTATNAPVKPQKWYQRLAQGAFLGIASKQPGESLGESVGRGVGFGAASAISSTGHGNIVRNIRNDALTKRYASNEAVSDERMGDLKLQQGLADKRYSQGIQSDREDRLQAKGIHSWDQAQSELELKNKELERKRANDESMFKNRDGNLVLREREVALKEKHGEFQQKLQSSHLSLDQSKAAEIIRHNKEMEGKGQETDQYIINLVGSKGEVKPMSIKVPKGADPENYVKTIKQGGMAVTPKGGSTSIDQRNKSAIEKLRPTKAGESKGLKGLIK
jgi:hypothetical protein